MPPGPVAVAIKDYAFSPASLTVSGGSTVIWTNLDSPAHQVVSDATSLAMTGSLFMSGQLQQGQTYSFTFTIPGTYLYHCGIHPFMTGTIIVT
jgi:plastocyanin